MSNDRHAGSRGVKGVDIAPVSFSWLGGTPSNVLRILYYMDVARPSAPVAIHEVLAQCKKNEGRQGR